jgi:hypothetical protein
MEFFFIIFLIGGAVGVNNAYQKQTKDDLQSMAKQTRVIMQKRSYE